MDHAKLRQYTIFPKCSATGCIFLSIFEASCFTQYWANICLSAMPWLSSRSEQKAAKHSSGMDGHSHQKQSNVVSQEPNHNHVGYFQLNTGCVCSFLIRWASKYPTVLKNTASRHTTKLSNMAWPKESVSAFSLTEHFTRFDCECNISFLVDSQGDKKHVSQNCCVLWHGGNGGHNNRWLPKL